MEKMNCDIIRDLIPSYVDEICSEATKNCVESHIEDCSECREMVKLCRDHVLTDKKAEKIALNGFQKIKKRMNKQFISNIILIAMLCFSMQRFHYYTENPVTSFAILLIICMCINLLINTHSHVQKKAEKRDYMIGFLSLIISIGIAYTFYHAVQKALINEAEPVFFGLEPQQWGPFFNWLFTAAFLLQLAFFIYCLLGINKLQKNLLPLSCLAITEIFLTSAYLSMLGRLDTPESFLALFSGYNLVSIVIAVLGTLTGILLMKKFKLNRSGSNGNHI